MSLWLRTGADVRSTHPWSSQVAECLPAGTAGLGNQSVAGPIVPGRASGSTCQTMQTGQWRSELGQGRRGEGRRRPGAPRSVRLSSQNLKSIPSPSWDRKKSWTNGKIPRSPAIMGESPCRGVAHLSQSSEGP